MPPRPLRLGRARPLDGASQTALDARDPSAVREERAPLDVPPHHLVTHAVVVGMTGSGKTGLCVTLVEEALRSRIPVLMIDVKGDLPNLGLALDPLSAASFAPWVDADAARREGTTVEAIAEGLASKWRDGLAGWGLSEDDVRRFRSEVALRVITPGTQAGEALHVLSPLEQPGDLWEVDEESARDATSAAVSLLLRMIGREADPTRGREHVLLSLLAERRLRAGRGAQLEALLEDLREPPIERVGALSVDEFLSAKERAALAQELNALVASPTFAGWREGAPLDVAAWMAPVPGPNGTLRTPATIVSVAHLEDEERMLVLGMVLDQLLAWVRGLSGTSDLRALVLFDEVFGFLPPHPANPPTKRPLLALLKQARAFGVGLALATQNPIDLDYKALSNAGVWFVGRLQTDADRERVVEGLLGSEVGGEVLDAQELAAIIKALPPRTFFVRDVHAKPQVALAETRWSLSWLRGPMTRQEIKRWSKFAGDYAAPRMKVAAPAAAAAAAPAAAAAMQPLPDGRGSGLAVGAMEAPAPVAVTPPAIPPGYHAWFPFPPSAPPSEWIYAAHAALVARVEIADAKIGYRESRPFALYAPIVDGGLDLARLASFDPDDFRNGPAAGARFAPLPAGHCTARGAKSLEKALREQAIQAARATVFVNGALELLSTPGEAREAFQARCLDAARGRIERARAEIAAKHHAKLQRASSAIDAAEAAASAAGASVSDGAGLVGMVAPLLGARAAKKAEKADAKRDKDLAKVDRLRAKVEAARVTYQEAVAKRDAELSASDAEITGALAATTARELVAKRDALVVEATAILWIAS
jgi:hypothetical protein